MADKGLNFKKIEGKDKGNVTLYALSTCVWCKKTKDLLSKIGVGFRYIYVDLLEGDDRKKAVEEVERYNPNIAFPTLVVGDKVIVGYKEKEIDEALGKGS